MRRVSSQATTSASRSAASTRRVTSSRLPIGVGQTISRPPSRLGRSRSRGRPEGQPVEGERRRADHPSLRPQIAPARSGPDRGVAAARARATAARAGSSSSSPAAITPPPTTTTWGLKKMLTKLAIATPRRRPTSFVAAIAAASPSWASSVTSGPASSRPGFSGPPPAPSGGTHAAISTSPPAPARCRRRTPPRAHGQGQVALALGFVHVDHHVPQLGTCPGRAAGGARRTRIRPPAIPVPIVSTTASLAAPRAAPARCSAIAAAFAVVVDEHRQPQPLGHHVARKAISASGRLTAIFRDSRCAGRSGRGPEADRLNLPPGRFTRFLGPRRPRHRAGLAGRDR